MNQPVRGWRGFDGESLFHLKSLDESSIWSPKCILSKKFNPFFIWQLRVLIIYLLLMSKEQHLFLGVLKKAFKGRSGERLRQLHLWLSNAWYSTEGTIWTVGKSSAFWVFTSCSFHSGTIRDTSLAIRVEQIFPGLPWTWAPHARRLLFSQLTDSPCRNGSSQVAAAWSTWSALGGMHCWLVLVSWTRLGPLQACWSDRLGLSSPPSLFHKALTYFSGTIKCLWAKEGGDPSEGEPELR